MDPLSTPNPTAAHRCSPPIKRFKYNVRPVALPVFHLVAEQYPVQDHALKVYHSQRDVHWRNISWNKVGLGVKALYFEGNGIGDTELARVLHQCLNLEVLHLIGCQTLTGKGLHASLSKLKALRILKINSCFNFSEGEVIHSLVSLSLREIHLEMTPLLGDSQQALHFLLGIQDRYRLESLTLKGIALNHLSGLSKLKWEFIRLPSLKILNLEDCSFGGEFLKHLMFNDLEELALSSPFEEEPFSGRFYRRLGRLENLKSISVSHLPEEVIISELKEKGIAIKEVGKLSE